jgi:hypothetical protein
VQLPLWRAERKKQVNTLSIMKYRHGNKPKSTPGNVSFASFRKLGDASRRFHCYLADIGGYEKTVEGRPGAPLVAGRPTSAEQTSADELVMSISVRGRWFGDRCDDIDP